MLRSAKSLYGYLVKARDGDTGKVYDFFFDDEKWKIRYLVVETGGFLSGRKVLIAPVVLGTPDWKTRHFPVALTKNQIESSPDIDVHKPISRRLELELHRYYKWNPYWPVAGVDVESPVVPSPGADTPEEQKKDEKDYHLRSMKEITGYRIHASDGEIGHIDDIVIEGDKLNVRYIVVDTKNWIPGRRVLLSRGWIRDIDWSGKEVIMDLDRNDIKNSPEYDPSRPVNREYEEVLYDFYGRPKYWL